MKDEKHSRRRFMKTTAAVAGTATFGGLVPSSVLGANDRVNFGIIGTGGQGTGHLRSMVKRAETDNIRVVAVSDVYQKRLTAAMGICNGDGYLDYRELLERNDVDAVLIATPDHWHSKNAIDAMDAGKHVYCEKPITLTAEQAIELRDAVKRYKKVFQSGPQRTAQDKYWKAMDIIREGRIGKVTWAQGSWNRNPREGRYFGSKLRRDDPVGPHMTGEDFIDWDMWLGHKWGLAPRIPWNAKHFFYFRGYFNYNGGVATDLLYHFLAPLLLAITGENGEYPTRVVGNGGLYVNKDGREVPDVFMMNIDYPSEFSVQLESVLTNEFTRPTRIYGRHGTIEFTERSPEAALMGSPAFMEEFKNSNSGRESLTVAQNDRRDMVGNMVDVIREGGKLHCNVDLGCATMVAIKMGVESYRQNKMMLWDAENEKVIPG